MGTSETSETSETYVWPMPTLGDLATKVVQHAQTGVELVVFPDGQLFVWTSKEPIVLDTQWLVQLGTEAAQVAD